MLYTAADTAGMSFAEVGRGYTKQEVVTMMLARKCASDDWGSLAAFLSFFVLTRAVGT